MSASDIPRDIYDVPINSNLTFWNAGLLALSSNLWFMAGNTNRFLRKCVGVFQSIPNERLFVPVWHKIIKAGHWFDFRLFWYNGHPFMMFFDKNDEFRAFPRIIQCNISLNSFACDHSCDFKITKDVCIQHWPSYSKTRPEKNWMPFVYKNTLYAIYSVQPVYRVLRIDPYHKTVELLVEKLWDTSSEWMSSEVYGNTNAVFCDDMWLTFVHTKTPRRYITWYYAFSPDPPFLPVAYSTYPVFYPELSTETRKAPRIARAFDPVFFPVGAARVADDIYVSYGENDIVQRVAVFSLKDLKSRLKPC